MAKRLGVLASFPEDLISIPNTHMVALTMCKSHFRGSYKLFWALWVPGIQTNRQAKQLLKTLNTSKKLVLRKHKQVKTKNQK